MKKPTDHFSFMLMCLQSPQDETLQAQLKEWLTADAEARQLYGELKRLWELAPGAAYFEEADAPAATQRFLDQLALLPAATPVVTMPSHRRRRYIAAAAAVLLLAAGAAWWNMQHREVQWLSKATGPQADSLLLPDGSAIYLNKNSVVLYPATFNINRQVHLQAGEAFFRIAADPVHPFTVESGLAQIHVLGTSFNVKNAAGNVHVFVQSGSIAVAGEHEQGSLRLRAGQAATIPANGGAAMADSSASPNQMAWRTHDLLFEDASLQEVCAALSAYYQTNIIAGTPTNQQRRFNAHFNNMKLDDVLQTLSALYDYKFEKRNDTIYVK
ncbi:DUF4974 domain-containing protein [Chitinophaga sp. Mgbs1]|uniref:DUF4974 domain-containing protein n=1 Tax=Chitinophaga solisilvae TaxID=1233460 RepID=A0A3S1D2A8_9BACT|nr:DUF4974 domain-containing protein [Chitinophaga solisilvae]